LKLWHKKAKEGSYNHLKLLTDLAYEETKDERVVNNAPTINFFNSNDVQRKVEDKIIDITNRIDNGTKD
jgi:predicted hydrolase (HD superfamily)